jgi:enoyl-CoA hydratase/carnithine racemase
MTDFVHLEKHGGIAVVTLNSPETRNTLSSEREYAGDPINAREALACGLVSKVVPAAALIDEARKLAGLIAANPGHRLRMAKRLIREAQTSRLETILEMSAAFQALAHSTEEHRALIADAVARISR